MDTIVISMAWESNLSVNDRYSRGSRPKLRPEVQAWQEELAWEIKSSIAHLDIDLGPQIVVDIEMSFPDDGRRHDADNYFKSIFDAVEMGTGINDESFVPYLRGTDTVPLRDSGFTIRLYSAHFAGHGLTGTLRHMTGGDTIVVLDRQLPQDWDGSRVKFNLGVIQNEP